MTKTFTLDGTEYTVTTCTAIALTAGDTERQNALLIEHTADSGEEFQKVCFGYEMPKTTEDFDEMCNDSAAWESDYEVLATIDITLEPDQEAMDAQFRARINQEAREHRARIEAAEAALERIEREALEAQERHEREVKEAALRDRCWMRSAIAVVIGLLLIRLHSMGGIQLWVAIPGVILCLVFVIINFVAYATRNKRKEV